MLSKINNIKNTPLNNTPKAQQQSGYGLKMQRPLMQDTVSFGNLESETAHQLSKKTTQMVSRALGLLKGKDKVTAEIGSYVLELAPNSKKAGENILSVKHSILTHMGEEVLSNTDFHITDENITAFCKIPLGEKHRIKMLEPKEADEQAYGILRALCAINTPGNEVKPILKR